MNRLLRVAFADLPVPERDDELKRLLGEDVQVITLADQPEPLIIAEFVEQLDCQVVVFDVAPPGAIKLVSELRPVVRILRPVFDEQLQRDRYGYPTRRRVFAGYSDVSTPE